ncbi:MAG TPA: hypothetical protein VKY85_07795 [Candidatus Angelobacter sp.]|nr:hypothetical protein [Candidatus Angelobacter sp.]
MKTTNKKQSTRSQLEELRKRFKIRPLIETKRREVERALVLTKGDKVLAAALLGIGKTTVYRTLER